MNDSLVVAHLNFIEARRAAFAEARAAGMPAKMPKPGYARQAWIRDAYRVYEKLGVSPPTYMVDWLSIFSPIERDVWAAIRYRGLPLRPQYPVGRFFADFADPEKKIVIECDGRAFHADKEADAMRDAEMIADGWRVFRIEGWECKQPEIDWEWIADLRREGDSQTADATLRDWMMRSADGVVCAIGCEFYGLVLDSVDPALILHTLRDHECTGSLKGAKWSSAGGDLA